MIKQYHSWEKRNSCKHLKFKGVCCSRGPEVSCPVGSVGGEGGGDGGHHSVKSWTKYYELWSHKAFIRNSGCSPEGLVTWRFEV